ncbi:MAG: hypothetical protein ACOC41_06115 [Chitinivibrionales bacterium]
MSPPSVALVKDGHADDTAVFQVAIIRWFPVPLKRGEAHGRDGSRWSEQILIT